MAGRSGAPVPEAAAAPGHCCAALQQRRGVPPGEHPGLDLRQPGLVPELIAVAVLVEAAGTPPKQIREVAGRVNTGESRLEHRAHDQPPGWAEPGSSRNSTSGLACSPARSWSTTTRAGSRSRPARRSTRAPASGSATHAGRRGLHRASAALLGLRARITRFRTRARLDRDLRPPRDRKLSAPSWSDRCVPERPSYRLVAPALAAPDGAGARRGAAGGRRARRRALAGPGRARHRQDHDARRGRWPPASPAGARRTRSSS